MYPARSRFWNAVASMSLFPSHPNLDDARVIFDKPAHGFLPKPHIRANSPTR